MILVTGASGNNGIELIKLLSKSGVRLRGMTRKPQPPTTRSPGVEFVTADFDDADSIRRTLEGVEQAFLVTPSSERVEEQQLRFVELARTAGVRNLVYLSQLHAARKSPVRFLRYHAVVEDAISESGMKFTNLRPNLYMQGLLAFASSIGSEGRFFAPIGQARVSIVDVRDTAAVAAAALTESGHDGKTYDLTGPEALTHGEIAAQLSDALGKQVTFIDIPEETMRNALNGFGLPEWQADGLIEDYAHYRRGEAETISTATQDVTGHQARSFSTFAQDYKQAFLQ